jgi:serine/threonine-protein kinase HipA
VQRIHQEDACQALGRDPEGHAGRGKYEAYGGPALRDVAGVLGAWAGDRAAQLDRLASAVTFTVVIGNSDAHAKNLSFLHTVPGTIELAPLYDTVPTMMWPKLLTRAAMTINARRDLGLVTLDDVATEASRWGHDRARARRVAVETAERVQAAINDNVVDSGSKLGRLVADRARRLLDLAARPSDSTIDAGNSG